MQRRRFFAALLGVSAAPAAPRPEPKPNRLYGVSPECALCHSAMMSWGHSSDDGNFVACSNPSCEEYQRPYEPPSIALKPVKDRARIARIRAEVEQQNAALARYYNQPDPEAVSLHRQRPWLWPTESITKDEFRKRYPK